MEGQRDRWILGDLFLRAYDVIHDYGHLKVGLVGEARTVPTDGSPGTMAELFGVHHGSSATVGIAIGVVAVVGLGAATFGGYIWYKKK